MFGVQERPRLERVDFSRWRTEKLQDFGISIELPKGAKKDTYWNHKKETSINLHVRHTGYEPNSLGTIRIQRYTPVEYELYKREQLVPVKNKNENIDIQRELCLAGGDHLIVRGLMTPYQGWREHHDEDLSGIRKILDSIKPLDGH